MILVVLHKLIIFFLPSPLTCLFPHILPKFLISFHLDTFSSPLRNSVSWTATLLFIPFNLIYSSLFSQLYQGPLPCPFTFCIPIKICQLSSSSCVLLLQSCPYNHFTGPKLLSPFLSLSYTMLRYCHVAHSSSVTLKMAAASSSRMLVPSYQSSGISQKNKIFTYNVGAINIF